MPGYRHHSIYPLCIWRPVDTSASALLVIAARSAAAGFDVARQAAILEGQAWLRLGLRA